MTKQVKQSTTSDPFRIPDDPNPIIGIFIDVTNKGGTDSTFELNPINKFTKKPIYTIPQTLIMPDGKKVCWTKEEFSLCWYASQMLPTVVKRVDTIVNKKEEHERDIAALKDKLKKQATLTDEEKELLLKIIN